MPVREMIDTYPAEINLDRDLIADVVQATIQLLNPGPPVRMHV